MLDQVHKYIEEFSGLTATTQHKILISVVAILVLWLLRFLIKHIIFKNTQKIKRL
jgi:hypothetical protein